MSSIQRNIEDIKNTKNELKRIKVARARVKNIRRIRQTTNSIKGTTEHTKKAIKTVENINNMAKTGPKATKTAIKNAKKAYHISKQASKKIAKTLKRAIKVTITVIKAIILATKTLIVFLFAGGWIITIIIILICLIAMLCSSIFGIFFSSEKTDSKITVGEVQQITTMNQVISDLNKEFMNKISQIQKENPYDEYDITSDRAEWKDVLAIYSVKINGGNNQNEVLTINDEKVEQLKQIFWEMNEITFTKDEKTETKTVIHLTSTEKKTVKTVTLHINIKSKSLHEMAEKYNFNNEQIKQLEELTDEKYASMWNTVIYGISIGSSDIVAVASSQIDNVGGEPFWSWYGFNERVEWCACFVSWCANQCGYIESGIIPKFSSCQSEGVAWFKACNLWKDRGFIPKERRYYIF